MKALIVFMYIFVASSANAGIFNPGWSWTSKEKYEEPTGLVVKGVAVTLAAVVIITAVAGAGGGVGGSGGGSGGGNSGYDGNCEFDNDIAADGTNCGERSAESRPGGY